jgi:hypothetical protein
MSRGELQSTELDVPCTSLKFRLKKNIKRSLGKYFKRTFEVMHQFQKMSGDYLMRKF